MLLRCHLFFLLLSLLAGVSQAGTCPDTAAFRNLVAAENLYVGEIHGTVEAPAFVRCLVEAKIQASGKPLVVSLEMPPEAAREDALFWKHGTDGRASQAMWALHAFLLERQQKGQLILHYHAGFSQRDQSQYEQSVASALKDIMSRSRLLAYAGHFHSRKQALPLLPELLPSGALLGEEITRVTLEWLEAGSAWFCSGEPVVCEASPLPARNESVGGAGVLKDGATYGHDLAYFFSKFTASPPRSAP